MSGKITEELFKIIFSLLIPIMIIRNPKIRESRIHIPFNFLVITISTYISITKVKSHEENSVTKLRNYHKYLNGLAWTQIGREMGSETLMDCYWNCTSTK